MKLTTPQIERIKEDLAAQELCFKEFEAEMLDHICTSLEESVLEEAEIQFKVNELIYSFDGEYESLGTYGNQGYYSGLKAIELRRFRGIEKRLYASFLKSIKKQLFSFRIIFWVVLFWLLSRFAFDFSLLKAGTFSSGFVTGIMGGLFGFSLATLFSKTPLWNSDTYTVFKLLPKIYKMLRPTSAEKHAWLKLWQIPVLLFLLNYELNFFFELPHLGSVVLIWLSLLFAWSIYSIAIKRTLIA